MTAAVGACYGTYAVLSKHYTSEQRFRGLRDRVRAYTADKLRPRTDSLEEVGNSLSYSLTATIDVRASLHGSKSIGDDYDAEVQVEQTPTIIEIVDKKLSPVSLCETLHTFSNPQP